MKNLTIFYWCPFISHVATVKAVINSAYSLIKYSNSKYEPKLINVFGEWDAAKNETKKKKIIITKKLINFSYLNINLNGFLISRIKYIFIFIFSFFPLINLLKSKKPDYLIIHLVTSLPLIIFSLINFETKLILRISGFPQLNFHRKLLWRLAAKNIYKITCPTKETYMRLKTIKEFKNKICILRDPIILPSEIIKKTNKEISATLPMNNFILSIGRLTRQKNFNFLLENYAKINIKNLDLVIIGNGELKKNLKKKIKQLNIKKKVFLIDKTTNVFNILKKCQYFVLTSLWEDPGFVLIEAAFMNKTILSSDCASGPREILSNGKGGFLFKSNNNKDFISKFKLMVNTDKNMLKNKQMIAKYKSKEFSVFKHYKNLNQLLRA